MIPKIIGYSIDNYFKRTFSDAAPPPMTEFYADTEERKLKTFVYPAHTNAAEAPALALFFGGAWHHGNPWQLAAVARDLSRLGVTVYLPEYRVAARDKVSAAESLSDVRGFYQWMMDRHGSSPIFFGGSSAGSFLAANTALTAVKKPMGLILLNPALNLDRARIARFWPILEQPRAFGVDDLLALDPINHISEGAPPTLILHGGSDPIIPFRWVESYAAKAKLRGENCRLISFDGYSHGFANQALFPNAHARAVNEVSGFIDELSNQTKRLEH